MCPYNIYEKKQKQYEELLYKKEKLQHLFRDVAVIFYFPVLTIFILVAFCPQLFAHASQ